MHISVEAIDELIASLKALRRQAQITPSNPREVQSMLGVVGTQRT